MERPMWMRRVMPVSSTGWVKCSDCHRARFAAGMAGKSLANATCPKHKPLPPDHWTRANHPSKR